MNKYVFGSTGDYSRLVVNNGCFHYVRYYNGEYTTKTGGPALIDIRHQTLAFFVDGIQFSCTRSYCDACKMSKEETLIWVIKYGDGLPSTCREFYGMDIISAEQV